MNYWAAIDTQKVPDMRVTPPGPKSREYHERASRLMKGYSSLGHCHPKISEAVAKGIAIIEEALRETEQELGVT